MDDWLAQEFEKNRPHLRRGGLPDAWIVRWVERRFRNCQAELNVEMRLMGSWKGSWHGADSRGTDLRSSV